MRQFDILSRSQSLDSSCLLEASAGTGKTHSIENIAARLLIEGQAPVLLENILIVTFTRAATEDLKVRIRRTLFQLVSFCKLRLQGDSSGTEKAPDYLQAIFQRDDEHIENVRKKLELALTFFDRAQIFTIHGFCHRMLKEFLFEGDFCDSQDKIAPSKVFALIHDFFCMAVDHTLISPQQLKRAIDYCKGMAGLEKRLYKFVQGSIEIQAQTPLKEQLKSLNSAFKTLKASLKVTPELLLEDFKLLAPSYKDICDLKKEPKAENLLKVENFIALLKKEHLDLADFDLLIADGLYWSQVIQEENRDKRRACIENDKLHCPDFTKLLKGTLEPLIAYSRSPERALATLGYKCRQLVKSYFEQQEVINFDDLLHSMVKALDNPDFVQQVQKRYSVAIIDEFQDTDATQWEIFSKLFYGNARLFLVGDPKQSIYGFRQADIYTYLQASQALGAEQKASLSKNYRSTTSMVEALNFLFDAKTIVGLMVLPRLGKVISYSPVQSSGSIAEKPFDDQRTAVNFFGLEILPKEKKPLSALEEEYFFPFIAQEILTMHKGGHLKLSGCAILVADRYQSERVAGYLARFNIPSIAQHNRSLVAAPSFKALKEALQGILKPRRESALKAALATPIFSWTKEELLTLDDIDLRADKIAQFLAFKQLWEKEGFASLFHALLNCYSKSNSKLSVVEEMLLREGGLEFYRSLEQLSVNLMEQEQALKLSPYQLIDYFDELEKKDSDEEAVTKLAANPLYDAVNIVTIHSSKGLEFEVVFSIGLIKSCKKPDYLVPVMGTAKAPCLKVVDTPLDPHYQHHCQEIEAEKLRQLYVAWTRAKQRLYCPLLIESEEYALAEASPMALYLKLLQASIKDFPLTDFKALNAFIVKNRQSHLISCLDLKEKAFSLFTMQMPQMPLLQAELKAKVPKKYEYMHSFTSLSTSSLPLPVGIDEEKLNGPFSSENVAPHDFSIANKCRHTLPAGPATGNLLHALLENIPFNLACKGPKSPLLQSYVEKFICATPFAEWQEVLCHMIYDTLEAIISVKGESFSLKQVSDFKCYREHEFCYAIDECPLLDLSQGYVKGVIDLIFEFNGKYYLIDWKSNWLGNLDEDYRPHLLKRSMDMAGYHLQANLYTEALKRYLAVCDRGPFDEVFGGVIYIFLRGVRCGTSDGILCL